MNQSVLSAMSDEELRSIFERLAVAMSKCELTKKYNSLAQELYEVRKVIKSRGQDTIEKFLPLLSHDVPRVRLSAATLCYDLALADCRRVLMELEKPPNYSVGSDAMLFLYEHDNEFRKKLGEEADRAYGRDWRHPK